MNRPFHLRNVIATTALFTSLFCILLSLVIRFCSARMSRDESDKDSNGKKDKSPSKRVYRPRPSVYFSWTLENHNIFISVTLLRTGEVIYLNRLNTNHAVRRPHYVTSHGKILSSVKYYHLKASDVSQEQL